MKEKIISLKNVQKKYGNVDNYFLAIKGFSFIVSTSNSFRDI